jgi:hypothetical protein
VIRHSSFVTVEEKTLIDQQRNGASGRQSLIVAVIIDCNCKEVPVNPIIRSRTHCYQSRQPRIHGNMFVTLNSNPSQSLTCLEIIWLKASESTRWTSCMEERTNARRWLQERHHMSIPQMGFLSLHETVQIKMIRSRRVTWERHLARMVEMRNAYCNVLGYLTTSEHQMWRARLLETPFGLLILLLRLH